MSKRVYPKDVIGTSYTTKIGNIISVIEQLNSEGLSLFKLNCNVCSEDEELFIDGEITGTIRNIRKRMCVCGCNRSYQWNERQQIIRVNRLLKDTVYVFKNFEVLGKFGSNDYVIVTNTVTNIDKRILICNVIAGYLPAGKTYTEVEVSEINTLLKTKHNFPLGFKVTPNYNASKKCWDFYCPVCSDSIYTEKGVHSGVFTTRLDALKVGHIPCRCSGKYSWSKEERELQLTLLCKKIGYTFIKITSWGQRKKEFEYCCSKGHYRKGRIHTFIYQNKRCKLCSKDAWNMSGYYPDRVEEEDTLYLLKFMSDKEVFIKIGRTFHLAVRKNYYPKEYTITTLGSVINDHETVYREEQRLQAICNQFHYTPIISFGGSVKECFTQSILYLPEIVNTFDLT